MQYFSLIFLNKLTNWANKLGTGYVFTHLLINVCEIMGHVTALKKLAHVPDFIY